MRTTLRSNTAGCGACSSWDASTHSCPRDARSLPVLIVAGAAALWASSAPAADGCLVLLCFAAPSWRSIPQCVPPIQSVLRDLARGRPFPTCSMSGNGNQAANRWSAPPAYCPPQYTVTIEGPNGPIQQCLFDPAVSVTIGGAPWLQTWWNFSGESVTEYFPAAKTSLGTWESRFDDDYSAWLAAQPSALSPCITC
jgi:hypothetical protein